MPTYQWSCPVCEASNISGAETCSSCGCPVGVSGKEIEARRKVMATGAEFPCPISIPIATLSIERLSVGSVYKLWLIGLAVVIIPMGSIAGTLSLFGYNTVAWNGQYLHGVVGLFGGVFVGVFLSIVFTVVFGTMAQLGLWLYSKKWRLSLAAKNVVAHYY